MNILSKKNLYQQAVIGEGPFALEAHYRIYKKAKDNNQQVPLLVKEEIDLDSIKRSVLSYCRGLDNLAYLKNIMGTDSDLPPLEEVPSLFYKDMKFHPFGGRTKSFKLMRGEEVFTQPAMNYWHDQTFSFLRDEEYLAQLPNIAIHHPLKKVVRKVREENGQDQKYWVLEGVDGSEYLTSNLIWGDTPYRLTTLAKGDELFDHNFIQFAEHARGDALLMLHFELDAAVTDYRETLLIPISMTYDHGHYIGTFRPSEGGGARGTFVAFVDREQSNSEEVAKMVRALKRRLEKVFDRFASHLQREFIVLSDESFAEHPDDNLVDMEKLKEHNLMLVGMNAPLAGEQSGATPLSLWARGVASLEGRI